MSECKCADCLRNEKRLTQIGEQNFSSYGMALVFLNRMRKEIETTRKNPIILSAVIDRVKGISKEKFEHLSTMLKNGEARITDINPGEAIEIRYRAMFEFVCDQE